MNKLDGWKTYLVAIATIVYAVVIVGGQNGDWATAAQMIATALGISALRHGVAKTPGDQRRS